MANKYSVNFKGLRWTKTKPYEPCQPLPLTISKSVLFLIDLDLIKCNSLLSLETEDSILVQGIS